MKQELERRSTLENRNWSDRSSRSTTTTPLSALGMIHSGKSAPPCSSSSDDGDSQFNSAIKSHDAGIPDVLSDDVWHDNVPPQTDTIGTFKTS